MLVVVAGLAIGVTKPALQSDKGFGGIGSGDDLGMFIQSSPDNASQIPDRYSMSLDPAAKEQTGEQIFNELTLFFQTTERAIETKNMEALMAQYSDDYRDGDMDIKSVAQAWQRIFAKVDDLATLNNIKLVNISPDKKMVVLQSSGLLVGVPDDKKWPVTIDNWNRQDHILIKEASGWKLIGIYGLERKRLWFENPIHPLI